jgi:hypothetical protein
MRFAQEGLSAFADESNPYWYVGNNSLSRFDPYGLSWWEDFWHWLEEVLGHSSDAADVCHVGTGAVECEDGICRMVPDIRHRNDVINDPVNAPL